MSSFAPETLLHIGSFPITNTLIHTFIVDGILIGTSIYIAKNSILVPKFFQNIVETVIEGAYNFTESIAHKPTKYIFPYVMTFFLFIFIANSTSLLPGFGSIGFFHKEETKELTKTEKGVDEKHEKEKKVELIPLLRGATSDLNTTLALALISVFATHMLSIKITGIKDYLSRWFSLNPIYLYVGILELTAEITKIVSLSFRLFGNIYAGEVALATVSNIFAFLLPLPFLLLENIVAVIQALVFSILTLVFMSLFTTPHHAVEGEHH